VQAEGFIKHQQEEQAESGHLKRVGMAGWDSYPASPHQTPEPCITSNIAAVGVANAAKLQSVA
jgi:hypothetical protein